MSEDIETASEKLQRQGNLPSLLKYTLFLSAPFLYVCTREISNPTKHLSSILNVLRRRGCISLAEGFKGSQ
jgi:hypothetical protein